jgi:hypothetical protein
MWFADSSPEQERTHACRWGLEAMGARLGWT